MASTGISSGAAPSAAVREEVCVQTIRVEEAVSKIPDGESVMVGGFTSGWRK
jgi:hypothetical protein